MHNRPVCISHAEAHGVRLPDSSGERGGQRNATSLGAPREARALVLASGSPRRRRLLARLGLPFEVVVPDVDERAAPEEAPAELARRLGAAKAADVALQRPGATILAADTVVAHAGQVLGKPADAADAARMLRRLRGRAHEVVTAVCVAAPGRAPLVDSVRTAVEMRAYTDAEMAAYLGSGDPMDKAGAYAIQHPDFRPVARLAGCYTNVVGLPLCLVVDLLRAVGVEPHLSQPIVCYHAPGWAPPPRGGPGCPARDQPENAPPSD